MQERIILASGIQQSGLLKNLASHGINTINLRIMNAGELARLALLRSGIAVTEDFLSEKEETILIGRATEGESYFKKPKYTDIQEIAAAVRRMRSLVMEEPEEEKLQESLPQGIFTEKNNALLSIYRKYMRILAAEKQIDSVSLIRKAIREVNELPNTEFLSLTEFPPAPLHKALLQKLSGGKAQMISVADLYRKPDLPLTIDQYLNCYGASNEVETVISDIYPDKRPDQCVAVVTDPSTYAQLFLDYALQYDLPITFGCGIPITDSNPAQLLRLYYQWMTSGFFGADALSAMLYSPAFDRKKLTDKFPEAEEGFKWRRFFEALGALRLTNDADINRSRISAYRKAEGSEKAFIPFFTVMAEELALSTDEFIRKYARIRKSEDGKNAKLLMKLDTAALSSICEDLQLITRSGLQETTEDIIETVLKKRVLREASEPGKLHVTDISGAFSCIRKNLYLIGMSASKFPGSPRENYLLLDADLRLFGEQAEPYTSDRQIREKREKLKSLMHLAAKLESRITLSYAGLNVAELKKDNKSSMIFELFREEHGEQATSEELENTIREVAYFGPAVSVTRGIGKAYVEGKTIIPRRMLEKALLSEKPDLMAYLDRAYSPSALTTFFDCRRRFYLHYIIGLPEPEETDNFQIISPADSGTLAHSLMETLGNSGMSPEAFRSICEKAFDEFISIHPVLISDHIESARTEFLDMMEYAYESDPGREVLLHEEDINAVHESGVKLHGLPDRVEKLSDGSILIVDYKTGRTVKHKQDDIDSCLQIVIYAYLMEQRGEHVCGGDFRYIHEKTAVSCRYDEDMKQKLSLKLSEFRQAFEEGSFDPPEEIDKNTCKYCKYIGICRREAVSAEAGEEQE